MQEAMKVNEAISEICVDPQPTGLRAVYLVETRSRQEAGEVDDLFAELESRLQVRRLCDGKLVSYVVQADESDVAVLDELEEVLRTNYSFVVTQRSFDDLIHRIVHELAAGTGSKVLEVPRCNICGKAEPFPTTLISLVDQDGLVSDSRCYCGKCTAEAAATTNKEFVRSLLMADERDFGVLKQAELVRRPSPSRPMRFRIKN